jgi:hypothetical protein
MATGQDVIKRAAAQANLIVAWLYLQDEAVRSRTLTYEI